MKNKLLLLLVALSIGFVTNIFAQRGNYRIANGIAITGAMTNFNIVTDNFNTKQDTGFLGGMTATVDIPNRWYNISFGMQLSENHLKIEGRSDALTKDIAFIEYKLFAAQVAMLAHIKLIDNNVTIDVGPMLQYNGKLELNNTAEENYYINNYSNVTASDITNISQFNINGAIGASAGLDFIKLKVQYIYGFTNIFKKLNSQNLDTSSGNGSFKGNQSMLVLGAFVSF
jgi:hypothetical protein